jgi:hypothetical protein
MDAKQRIRMAREAGRQSSSSRGTALGATNSPSATTSEPRGAASEPTPTANQPTQTEARTQEAGISGEAWNRLHREIAAIRLALERSRRQTGWLLLFASALIVILALKIRNVLAPLTSEENQRLQRLGARASAITQNRPVVIT